MSISDPTRIPGPTLPTTTKPLSSLSPEDAEEARKLDAIFERIRKNIPEAPYILTVPCSEPRYHHWSRHEAESWCQNTPFDPSEERLQYMSFLWREHADSCFVVRTEVDEERDRREAMKAQGIASVSSGTSTPVRSDVPKKKISLAAYKSKQANGLRGTSSAKQTPSASQEQAMKSETPVRKEHPLPAKPVDAPPAAHHGQKRAHEPGEKPSQKKPRDDAQPPPKKPRTSDSSTDKPTINTSTAQSTPHGLPPMISPISSPNPLGIPPLLSPTLPDVIEAELERCTNKHSRTPSNASSSSERKSNAVMSSKGSAKSRHDSPTRLPPSAEKKERAVKAVDSDGKPLSRVTDVPVKKATAVQADASTAKSKTATTSEKNPSLVVKLKYGRKRRMEVERYLRLPAKRKPRKEQEATNEDTREGDPVRKPDPQPKIKEGPLKGKTLPSTSSESKEDKPKPMTEKRARPTEENRPEAPPAKRQKPPPTVDTEKKPRTPDKPLLSPVASNRSAPKPQYITPRKDLKNVSMMRSNSNDSNGATATPGQSGSTPASGQADALKGATSTPANGKLSDAQVWSSSSRKLNDLGRRLKHEAQSLTGKNASPKDRKRGAVLSIECLLAYMGAYSSLDYMYHLQHRPGNIDNNWRTMLPLHRFFRSACQEFPHLEALRLNLGAVISARIAAIATERLHAHPSAAASAPSPADTNNSSNSAAAPALSEKEDKYLLKAITDAFVDMTAFVAEARAKLPVEDLMTTYPKTWQGQAKPNPETTARWEKLAAGQLEGGYLLPLSADTTPLQAVRMGVAFLGEWMARERVEYRLQVKL